MKYTIKLKDKKDIAEGTMAFIFEKPQGFEFKAGQAMDLTLVNPPETDAEGNIRPFSIAAAPYEDHLLIATRMRDTAFKRVLKAMPPGAELEMEGPSGSFTMHNDAAKPAVFLAGGIGITPFHSIIKNAAKQKLPHRIFLFFSNRRPEDAVFLEELIELQKENPNYKLIATMTDMSKSKQAWNGEQGYINKEMLGKYLNADVMASGIFYLAGPPAMVTALRKTLNDAGINDDNIRTEEFSGY